MHPQLYILLFDLHAQCLNPQEIWSTLFFLSKKYLTTVGYVLGSVSPWPNWPNWLLPKEYKIPLVVNNKQKSLPHSIWLNLTSGTGISMGVLYNPSFPEAPATKHDSIIKLPDSFKSKAFLPENFIQVISDLIFTKEFSCWAFIIFWKDIGEYIFLYFNTPNW